MGNNQSAHDTTQITTQIVGGILGGVSGGLRAAGDEHTRKAARIIGTVGVSAMVLGNILTEEDQRERLLELVQKHDLPGLIQALASPGGVHFEPNFFPDWIRKAGGYFPKFAQVLSVRPDLIKDPEVLAGLSRCLEDMDVCSLDEVCQHLRQAGWAQACCARVGPPLNAGTIAQVNQFTLPDGSPAVVKVAWPKTYAKMATDFKLFRHADKILKALDISSETASIVAAMFDAVDKAAPSVLAEFDLRREAGALQLARGLCSDDWPAAYRFWQQAMQAAPNVLPPHLAPLLFVALAQSAGWSANVPEPLDGYIGRSAMAMSLAGGESLQKLLSGVSGQAGQQEAATVLIGYAVPFIGWLLLCMGSSHLAHADPHPGNFRWDSDLQQLWVLDWGNHVTLSDDRRRALCFLITLVADEADDTLIADGTRAFGASGPDDHALAEAIKGMLNASHNHAPQDAINNAAIDNMLENISDDVVPVVRCLSILGGMLQAMQQKLHEQMGVDVPLSLASLWKPFALMG